MQKIQKSALVPYSAEVMFALVNDIESYPSFLPWCRATTVISRSEQEVSASIDVSRMGVHKTFATRNVLTAPSQMEMVLLDGPFKHFQGIWRFEDLNGEGCKISLAIDYEVSGRWLDMAFSSVFGHIGNSLVDAFCQRAKELYG